MASESINAREGIKTDLATALFEEAGQPSESINAREGIKTDLATALFEEAGQPSESINAREGIKTSCGEKSLMPASDRQNQ